MIPLTTEHDEPRRPVANIAIMVLTCLTSVALLPAYGQVESAVFAFLAGDPYRLHGVAGAVVLQRDDLRLTQLLAHAFMHADLAHLVGNVLALLALGNAVNARIGHRRYVALYLLSAFAGAAGWLLFGDGKFAVGASGAVSGVAAAFLVLFPITRVRVLWWFLGLGLGVVVYVAGRGDSAVLLGGAATVVVLWVAWSLLSLMEEDPPEGALLRLLGFRTIPLAGLWVVLLYLAADLIALAGGEVDGVAHEAHLAGSAGGAAMAVALLAIGAVRGTALAPTLFDLLSRTRPPERVAAPHVTTRRQRPALTFSDYARARRAG